MVPSAEYFSGFSYFVIYPKSIQASEITAKFEKRGEYLSSCTRLPCMMMVMNCFCGMVNRGKAFSLISSLDHCQRFSPS